MLADAQQLIYQEFRVREMRFGPYPLLLNIGDVSFKLPPGFLDPIAVLGQYQEEIKLKDLMTLQRARFIQGTTSDFSISDFQSPDFQTTIGWVQSVPQWYAIFGEQFQFDCASNAQVVYWALYYGSPPLLSHINKTNFLTDRYPHILRAACLAAAADFRKDDADYTRCATRLTAMITSAQTKDDLSNRGIEAEADYSAVSSNYGYGR